MDVLAVALLAHLPVVQHEHEAVRARSPLRRRADCHPATDGPAKGQADRLSDPSLQGGEARAGVGTYSAVGCDASASVSVSPPSDADPADDAVEAARLGAVGTGVDDARASGGRCDPAGAEPEALAEPDAAEGAGDVRGSVDADAGAVAVRGSVDADGGGADVVGSTAAAGLFAGGAAAPQPRQTSVQPGAMFSATWSGR